MVEHRCSLYGFYGVLKRYFIYCSGCGSPHQITPGLLQDISKPVSSTATASQSTLSPEVSFEGHLLGEPKSRVYRLELSRSDCGAGEEKYRYAGLTSDRR